MEAAMTKPKYERNELSVFLKGFRESNGISQRQLAGMLGVHYAMIASIEFGKQASINPETAAKLAKHLTSMQKKRLLEILTADYREVLED